MNFKKVYSESLDDIHGNPEVLEKILSYDTPKKSFGFRYVFSATAVCLAVAAVVVVNPFKTGTSVPDNPSNLLIAAEPAPIKVRSIEPEISEEKPLEFQEEPVLVTEYDVTALVDVEVVPETVIEQTQGLKVNSVEVLTGSSAVMARSISETVMMTADEYKEYIGADIPGVISAPEGMYVTAPEFVMAETDENGNIISEKAVFMVHSEDYERFAEISVSKTQDIVIPPEGYEVSDVCGNGVIVLSDGTNYNASFSVGDTQYLIVTGGIDETELNNLLISLNGGF